MRLEVISRGTHVEFEMESAPAIPRIGDAVAVPRVGLRRVTDVVWHLMQDSVSVLVEG